MQVRLKQIIDKLLLIFFVHLCWSISKLFLWLSYDFYFRIIYCNNIATQIARLKNIFYVWDPNIEWLILTLGSNQHSINIQDLDLNSLLAEDKSTVDGLKTTTAEL